MSRADATYIGEVRAVTGAVVSVYLRDDLGSTLRMVSGESYRVGQIGAFLRIPLGFNHLYGVCTQVGAAAAPTTTIADAEAGSRWLSLTLFGEALGGVFERGVSQFPTVGDEVHLVTTRDLEIIYSSRESGNAITIGSVAASTGIPGKLDLERIVTRHVAIVGATGSGKSNLTAVLLEAISDGQFPSSRTIVIDPHGEYASAVGDRGYVYRIFPESQNERPLHVPFWALPCDEFLRATMGDMTPTAESAVRDEIVNRKREAAKSFGYKLEPASITPDSPIPFNLKQLWFDLDDYERHTLADRDKGERAVLVEKGSADELRPNTYPAPAPGNKPPFAGARRGLSRQLELMRNRLVDGTYSFLLSPGPDYTPDAAGKTKKDLSELIASWIGHDRAITVLDISGSPVDAMAAVVGTLLRLIYDSLYWARDLPISGRNQPVLIVLEEAHLFLPEGDSTAAHRTIWRIAKEGRKYGVGLAVVTQRPSEIDSTILSQCGTIIALRMNNSTDRSKVSAALPDDLGDLTQMLPSLRTGEALAIGEATPIPSRILVRLARSKPAGNDPSLIGWKIEKRPDPKLYEIAVERWRSQRFGPKAAEAIAVKIVPKGKPKKGGDHA